MAIDSLIYKGWHLSAEGKDLCQNAGGNVQEFALNSDLKDIGEKWLPDNVSRSGRCEYVEGPGVLQVQKIRNIAAPKDNEESQVAPRMLKITLSDGHQNCNAIELEKLEKISLGTPPGTKICLKGTIGVENGFLMLRNKNFQFLGGRVDKLAENWELKKSLAKATTYRAIIGSEGGPPPYVPFGQRIQSLKPATKKENFKSLEVKNTEKKTEDEEFEQQRNATIAEALQAKEEGRPKTFGGQKQVGSDKDIMHIMEMGFTIDQANGALRKSNGNLQEAIDSLVSGNFRPGVNDRGFGDRRQPLREDRRDNVRAQGSADDRRDGGKGGRGRRFKDSDDFEETAATTRPSGPATLFDFLETKIKPSEGSVKGKSTDWTHQSGDRPSQNSMENPGYHQRSNQGSARQQRNYGESDRQDNRGRNSEQKSYGSSSRPESKNSEQFRNKNKQLSGSSYQSERSSNQNYSQQGRGGQSDRSSNQNFGQQGRGGQSDRSSNQNYSQQGRGGQSDRSSNQNYGQQGCGGQNDRSSNQNYGQQGRGGQSDRTSSQNKSQQGRGGQNDRSSNQNYGQQGRGGQSDRTPNQNYSQQGRGGQSERRGDAQWNQDNSYSDRPNSGRKQQNYRTDQIERSQSSRSNRNQNFEADGERGQNSSNRSSKSSGRTNIHNSQENNSTGNRNQYNSKQPESQEVNSSTGQQQADKGAQDAWKIGDMCMAKYWEDNKFYPAVIQAMRGPGFPTCSVLFIEYGNEEEVAIKDLQPLGQFKPPPMFQIGNQGNRHYQPQNSNINNSAIETMEFHSRSSAGFRKPSQQIYQPPAQRYPKN